jgi:hypothetical protein
VYKIIYLLSVVHPLKSIAYIIQSITSRAPWWFKKECIYTYKRGTFISTAGLLHTDKLQGVWSATKQHTKNNIPS